MKKPIYKRVWFWVLIVCVVIGIGVSNSGSNTTDIPKTAEEQAQIEYTPVDIDTLLKDYTDNAAKAKNTWQDKYIELTGWFDSADEDGTYFTMISTDDNYWLQEVKCLIGSDEQLNKMFEKKEKDIVVIKGQVKSLGEPFYDYVIKLHSIE